MGRLRFEAKAMSRVEVFNSLRRKPDISVLIVGAGINGIGTFRELALQGIDVLLIDKADFCVGASAASSRLAHGGLRYLENGEFRLVRESLTERNRLLRNAPHAVQPLPIIIPLFSWFSGILNAPLKVLNLLQKPSERGVVVVKLGMMLYDFLSRTQRAMPTHRMLNHHEALAQHPLLNPNIVGAATYYDSLMPQAERIGVEAVLDAEAACAQAHALNYVRLISASGGDVQLRDELSGNTLKVRPRVVVNAAGGWIDFVNGAMQHSTRYIGGTKGSHIIVDHAELWKTLNGRAIYFENRDGRLCIFLPFMDKVMIGATDIRIDDPDLARCTEEEIEYMLGFTSHVLPRIQVKRSDIVFHFSGVRPLINSDAGYEGLISREHSIHVIEPDDSIRFPIYSLVGGKWTTFRAFSEQAADKVLERLRQPRCVQTHDLAIGGGKDYPHTEDERQWWLYELRRKTGLTADRIQQLFERYGTRAEAIAMYIAAAPDSAPDTDIRQNPTYSRREIMFLAQNEKVGHLDDVILRRSLLAMLGCIDGAVLEKVGEAVGSALDWPDDQVRYEIKRITQILIAQHGVPAERLQLRAPLTT
jgi:glycerol-3-phosphate dehydrogenase